MERVNEDDILYNEWRDPAFIVETIQDIVVGFLWDKREGDDPLRAIGAVLDQHYGAVQPFRSSYRIDEREAHRKAMADLEGEIAGMERIEQLLTAKVKRLARANFMETEMVADYLSQAITAVGVAIEIAAEESEDYGP